MLGDLAEHPALLERGVEPRLDLVQAEEVRCLVHVIDDVIDRLRQVVDVLPVEGSDVLRVEQLQGLAREIVAAGFERLDLRLAHGVLRKLGEAALDEPRRLEQVLTSLREQVVEGGGLGNECEPHCGRELNYVSSRSGSEASVNSRNSPVTRYAVCSPMSTAWSPIRSRQREMSSMRSPH